ncbi:MAG TPA: family 16 glycoside hydrolase, partial [Puia sp.]|nr:family 16 glycoside hydrolase [Puia sp.]
EKGSIHLNAAEGAGVAWINNLQLTNGAIEVDIKGKDTFQLSFVGIAFRGTNDSTYDVIYFRPFNFHSPDPVRKTHAVQYVSDPDFDWPVLRSQFPNKYEQPVSPAPDPNDWFHVRIELNDKKIMVFVNGNKTPSLVVESLQKTSGKRIGYWVGNNSFGDWKNLKIVRTGN